MFPRLPRCALALAALLLALAPTAPSREAPARPIRAGTKAVLTPLVTGLKTPESVAVGTDGRVYVTEIGEFGKDGDGRVMVIHKGKAVPFTTGLDDPKGLVAWNNWLFTADKDRVWRIDRKGKATVLAAARAFPRPPLFLNDVEVDAYGTLYVSDSGNLEGKGGAVFRISPKGKVDLVVDGTHSPLIKAPNGLKIDGEGHLLVLDFLSGALLRVNLATRAVTKVAEGFGGGDGVARDNWGRIYLSDWKGGRLFVLPREGAKPVLLASGFESAADICLSPDGKSILVPDMKAGAIYSVPCGVPGAEVDERPLPVRTAVAFPKLKWTGWQGVTEKGLIVPHRPLVLTHAGDGSNRVFVATEHGVVHVFPNDQNATKTKIFLDIQDRVLYQQNQDEEGLLGLAFPPDYRKTGEFYVYYTPKKGNAKVAPPTPSKRFNVLSRFKVSRDDPDRADPASEEVLIRFQKPFWNHNGGTICFGPDGYLYVSTGDGGSANDPLGHAQNLGSLLGKVLRIDVNRRDPGLAYAVPKDNPFVGRKGARPEVWAYGLRNIWRMAFDRHTGRLWAADVGQNLWEEIDLVEKGGNYGWKLREGTRPFMATGIGPRADLIEPIWEYHHDLGKSITGGLVYRGKRVPELVGLYLYADYVTGHIWGLRYDERQRRVTGNHLLRQGGFPVYSFGEDEKGEAYFMTSTTTGQGIFRFEGAKR